MAKLFALRLGEVGAMENITEGYEKKVSIERKVY